MKRKFAGRMFVRRVGNKAILVGVIELPKESNIQTEALHTFHGQETEDGDFVIISTAEIEDITQTAKGMTPDCLLTMPIWRT